MKALPLILLILVAAAQITVPFSLIQRKEHILNEGQLIRLQTRPIDPADPFQGRYVRLNYERSFIPWKESDNPDIDYRGRIYAILETGEDGYARFVSWSREKPDHGLFLTTRYKGKDYRWNPEIEKNEYRGLRIEIPFDRFYMDEAKAPRAGKLAREATRTKDCWVEVRILDGKGVIVDVFAKGQSLRKLAAGTLQE